MKRFSILILLTLLLSGCSKSEPESNIFIVSYIKDDGTTIVYDTQGNNYTVSGDTLVQTEEANLIQKPVISYTPIIWDYVFVETLPCNYKCTPTDAFAYITRLKSMGYTVNQVSASPTQCVINVDGDYHYKFYIESDTTRMYCVNSEGEAVEPLLKE